MIGAMAAASLARPELLASSFISASGCATSHCSTARLQPSSSRPSRRGLQDLQASRCLQLPEHVQCHAGIQDWAAWEKGCNLAVELREVAQPHHCSAADWGKSRGESA